MILLISEKSWRKKAKKLVRYMDYIVIDGTGGDSDSESGSLPQDYANCQAIDGFAPDKKVWKPVVKDALDDYDDSISLTSTADKLSDQQKKAQKRYLKSKNFMVALGTLLNAIRDKKGKVNIFLVLKTPVYKNFSDKMAKRIQKILGENVTNVVYTYSDLKEMDDMSIDLSRSLTAAEVESISGIAKAIGQQYLGDPKEKDDDDDD